MSGPMKMGEIRAEPDGTFVMAFPNGGVQPVTLRCLATGHVMVEEVAGGGTAAMLSEPKKSGITIHDVTMDSSRADALIREKLGFPQKEGR